MDESRRLEQSEVYEFIGRLVQLLDEIHIDSYHIHPVFVNSEASQHENEIVLSISLVKETDQSLCDGKAIRAVAVFDPADPFEQAEDRLKSALLSMAEKLVEIKQSFKTRWFWDHAPWDLFFGGIHQLSEEELQARRDIQSREWLERQAAREDDSEGVPNEQAAERHQ